MEKTTYTLVGDYYIPNIVLPPMEDRGPLTKYGFMRRTWLKENYPIHYNVMTLTDTMFPHLWDTQEAANARYEQLMEDLVKRNPPPAKAKDPMGWVRHMNMLAAQADEMVIAEYITVKPPKVTN